MNLTFYVQHDGPGRLHLPLRDDCIIRPYMFTTKGNKHDDRECISINYLHNYPPIWWCAYPRKHWLFRGKSQLSALIFVSILSPISLPHMIWSKFHWMNSKRFPSKLIDRNIHKIILLIQRRKYILIKKRYIHLNFSIFKFMKNKSWFQGGISVKSDGTSVMS